MRKFLLGLIAFAVMATSAAFAANIGPKADVAAVSAAQSQRSPSSHIVAVHVIGNYALLDWTQGVSGGEAVYERTSTETWKRIANGGGAFGYSDLVHYGVPASIAHQFRP